MLKNRRQALRARLVGFLPVVSLQISHDDIGPALACSQGRGPQR